MKPRDVNVAASINEYFSGIPFSFLLGIQPGAFGPGWCHAQLPVRDELLQQTGVVHAGALSSLADQTAAAAAITLLPEDKTVVSLEFKINMLAPARGELLNCEARVLKAGRSIVVSEAEVYIIPGNSPTDRSLVSKLNVTLYVVDKV
jgi:uncharacterized protein (TIGR00369 family)